MNAPRITPEDLTAAIASEHYFTAAQGVRMAALDENDATPIEGNSPLRLLTICVLVLQNGFTVIGKSACVSALNFKEDIGRQYAFEDAREQLWPLLGYELKERMYQARQTIERVRAG